MAHSGLKNPWICSLPVISQFILVLSLRGQIADAVVVARYLGATLVLPDIRGSEPGDKRLVLTIEPLVYVIIEIETRSSENQRHPTI